MTTPLGIIDMTYDSMGRLLTRTQAGISTGYSYDAAGRLEQILLPDGRSIQYSYTHNDLVETIEDSLGNIIS